MWLEEQIIDDEEFLFLCTQQHPSFPHSSEITFSLASKDPAKCKADFKVQKYCICT